ncbi:flagellar protein FlaG [Halomonas sp. CUBES01]|uniref:Flagellar protein FlaG n=1 Tax=Vreelandella gomseomensis TaxID=370766 RepID=A0ABU1GCS7_9GAMM|nr:MULTISPECIES: flagellar protein FlaG [Halomonas]MDR5875276.1 flagellar protein FlaG [Halomonas gomseomensis]MEC4765861.1 flagellar protein FlaG [Halomonas sp. CUBES01]
MNSSNIDAINHVQTAQLTGQSPRQRLDELLDKFPTAGSQLSEQQQTEPTAGELVEPIQRINDVMRERGLEFDISENESRVITRVVDRDSGDVIRQIPAEEVLRIAERLEEWRGQFVSLEA